MKFSNPANQFLLNKEIEFLAKLIASESHKEYLLDGCALFMFMKIELETRGKYKNALENYLNNKLKKQSESILRDDKIKILEKMIFLFDNPDFLNESNLCQMMVDYQEKAEIAKERCEFTISKCFTDLYELTSKLSPVHEKLQPLFNLELPNNKELAVDSLWLLGQIMQDVKDIPSSTIVAEDSQRLKDSCYLGIEKVFSTLIFKERSK